MSHEAERRALLVADTSVLVNLAVLDRLELFAASGFAAHVPNHVVQEVVRSDCRTRLTRALSAGVLTEIEITDLSEMAEYARLRKRFGDGESAAMAVAFARGWTIAVDEAGPVRRMVIETLGAQRLLTTPGLLERALRRRTIMPHAIPDIRRLLARERYALRLLEGEGDVIREVASSAAR